MYEGYVQDVSAAYFAEEAEMLAGVHPTQVAGRIKVALTKVCIYNPNITFLNWVDYEGPRVGVDVNNELYGVFNYASNKFEGDEEEDGGD